MSAYPPQHQPMPPCTSGAGLCGAYEGFVNFNNGGTGFSPAPGTTKGVVKVQAGAAYVANANFDLLWRASATNRGCAANNTNSTVEKAFSSSPASKYVFTVYFKPGNCPPNGTDVILEVNFQ